VRRYVLFYSVFLSFSYLWFKVTPLYDVRLEDVLDRQHLPPLGEILRPFLLKYNANHSLGLKDFEVMTLIANTSLQHG